VRIRRHQDLADDLRHEGGTETRAVPVRRGRCAVLRRAALCGAPLARAGESIVADPFTI
jgi:hypothetical protein